MKQSHLVVMATLMLLILFVNGCQSKPSSLTIYQAKQLTIPPKTQIQTVDGIYTSQVQEVWYSAQSYLDLMQELNAKKTK